MAHTPLKLLEQIVCEGLIFTQSRPAYVRHCEEKGGLTRHDCLLRSDHAQFRCEGGNPVCVYMAYEHRDEMFTIIREERHRGEGRTCSNYRVAQNIHHKYILLSLWYLRDQASRTPLAQVSLYTVLRFHFPLAFLQYLCQMKHAVRVRLHCYCPLHTVPQDLIHRVGARGKQFRSGVLPARMRKRSRISSSYLRRRSLIQRKEACVERISYICRIDSDCNTVIRSTPIMYWHKFGEAFQLSRLSTLPPSPVCPS